MQEEGQVILGIFNAVLAFMRKASSRVTGRPEGWDPLKAAATTRVSIDRIYPKPRFRTFPHSLQPSWRRTGEPVYRSDTRPPEIIFSEGLHPKNPGNTDLTSYVAYQVKRPAYAFVSTSRDSKIHESWHEFGRHGWLYEIHAPEGTGINLPSAYDEVVFPGGVHARYIKRARPYAFDRLSIKERMPIGEWISNPNYNPS